jgi:hypothetical protein
MSPMLVVKRKMNTIKQPNKGDNAHQKPPNITHFSKNNSSRNIIKSVFNINLHHDPIKVLVEEGSDAKKDGLIASKGLYSNLMGGGGGRWY